MIHDSFLWRLELFSLTSKHASESIRGRIRSLPLFPILLVGFLFLLFLLKCVRIFISTFHAAILTYAVMFLPKLHIKS